MIIKGRAVRSIKHWGRYLSEVGENEKAVQHEIRGTVATELKEALWEMWDIARATKTKGNFLYHASFNLRGQREPAARAVAARHRSCRDSAWAFRGTSASSMSM